MKLFRNLLIATAAVAVFSGVSAFAEGSDNTNYQFNVDAANVATNVVSVAEADVTNVIADMGDQVTVVVVPAGATDITDANIYYINQDANSGAATMLTAMGTKALEADTDYEIWVGGSNGTIKKGFFTTKVATPEEPEGIPVALGDANQVGGVEILDVLAVLDHLAGIDGATLTGAGAFAADANQVGGIEILDVLAILDHLAGIDGAILGEAIYIAQ